MSFSQLIRGARASRRSAINAAAVATILLAAGRTSLAQSDCGASITVSQFPPGQVLAVGQSLFMDVTFGTPPGANLTATISSLSIRLDCANTSSCNGANFCVDEGPVISYNGDASLSFNCPIASTVTSNNPGGGAIPNQITFSFNPPLNLVTGQSCMLRYGITIQSLGLDASPKLIRQIAFYEAQCTAGLTATACGSVEFNVVRPEIQIVKTGSPTPICSGDQVTYTYVVTSPGNAALSNVTVVDDNGTPGIPGDDFNPTFTGGDTNNNNILEPGESWTYTSSTTLTATTTNIATASGSYTNAVGTVTVTDTDDAIIVVNPLPNCTIQMTQMACAKQYCVVTNACSPFVVTWTGPNNFMSHDLCIVLGENSDPGQYCVTVTDCNNCVTPAPCCFNFTPPMLAVQCTSAIACEGETGSLCATVEGNNPPFSVQWFNAANQPVGDPCTGLTSGQQCCVTVDTPGTYTAVVTDNVNCVKQCTSTYDEFGNRLVQTANQSVCQGSPNPELCATVSGGIAPYTVTWYNAANQPVSVCNDVGEGEQCCFTPADTAPGNHTYTAVAVDSSPVPGHCTGQAPATLTIRPTPNCFINSSRQKICDGQTATMCAVVSGGTPPYTYEWNTGSTFHCLVDVGQPGTYSVTVTDSLNCSTTCSFVLAHHEVQVEIACQPLSGQIQLCANIISGRPPFTYRWSIANTNPCIMVDPQAPCTTYLVTVNDVNGCSDTAMITLEPGPTGTCVCPGGSPPCPADVAPDGVVNVNDLLAVIGGWGACAQPCPPCAADCNADCTVNVNDLLIVISAWGPCP